MSNDRIMLNPDLISLGESLRPLRMGVVIEAAAGGEAGQDRPLETSAPPSPPSIARWTLAPNWRDQLKTPGDV
jgi:hypothetical protein